MRNVYEEAIVVLDLDSKIICITHQSKSEIENLLLPLKH